MGRGRALLVVAGGVLVMPGCVSGIAGVRFVGQVTQVSGEQVCIGAPEAGGQCVMKDGLTEDLRVDDCVDVEVPDVRSGPSRAERVTVVDRAEHPHECPAGG
ncbi:hypothetical protein [Angustibacter peucedani]